jgi:hypothetical protein
MHDSQRYRVIAGEYLLAARKCQPCYRILHLSMAASWLSLARQDEAMDDLLASWDTAEARVHAEQVTDPQAKHMMLGVVERYESIAHRAGKNA